MKIFKDLGINDSIVKVVKEEGFEAPSKIQEKAIPLILAGKDVIAGSATGSGKTLVFGVGIIQGCQKRQGIQSLILTPTRELAEQIYLSLKKFSKYAPLDIIPIYGGVSINPQIEKLRRADVVVGTPGRILDHLQRGTINLSKVKILVLDEADRMFDMGFKTDVERIIKRCPLNRQTLLFSATIDEDVVEISRKHMKNPEKIAADVYVDTSKLSQVYYDVADNMKFALLLHLLKQDRGKLVMIFCNTQQNTDFVANNLKIFGINALAIHGGFSQDKRNNVMKQFHSGDFHVLVCTDVAARGLDIKEVSHVYNYDLPKEGKSYIHRIGRTARAGSYGKAINILGSRDHDNFSRVLRENDVEILKEETPHLQRVNLVQNDPRNDKFGGSRFGGRNSSGKPDTNKYKTPRFPEKSKSRRRY